MRPSCKTTICFRFGAKTMLLVKKGKPFVLLWKILIIICSIITSYNHIQLCILIFVDFSECWTLTWSWLFLPNILSVSRNLPWRPSEVGPPSWKLSPSPSIQVNNSVSASSGLLRDALVRLYCVLGLWLFIKKDYHGVWIKSKSKSR